MDKKIYDVFISCKSEDYRYAKPIFHWLKSIGHNPFFAPISLKISKIHGEPVVFGDEIDSALEEAANMIVFATKAEYVRTGYVKDEWRTFVEEQRAGRKSGSLVTILNGVNIEDLPIRLRSVQSFSITNYKEGILRFLNTDTESSEEHNDTEDFGFLRSSKVSNPPNQATEYDGLYDNNQSGKFPLEVERFYQNGIWYFTTIHDNNKAIVNLEQAANAGHVEAQNLLGLVLCEEKEYSQAMQWFKKAGEQGYPSAQYNLGKLYYKGYLGEVDYKKALKCFVDAASNSSDDANNMLGVMYEEGKGVAQNYNTAYEYYLIAANAGNVAAQYNIGCLIEQNKVTHYKLEKTDAIRWFDLAAKQGDKDAEIELKKLCK